LAQQAARLPAKSRLRVRSWAPALVLLAVLQRLRLAVCLAEARQEQRQRPLQSQALLLLVLGLVSHWCLEPLETLQLLVAHLVAAVPDSWAA